MINVVLIFLCPFLFSQKSNLVYRSNPESQSDAVHSDQYPDFNNLDKNAVDITKYLPNGFVQDATIDYTVYIQKGIYDNKIVKMPDFPLLINENGINVRSGSRIIFQEKTVLKMRPNNLENYGVLKLTDVDSVVIYSPVIVGERNMHIGNKGEWGMGLLILSASHIQVFNPQISDCWGDGIYIGDSKGKTSSDINILDAKIDSCRRNGISISNGLNVRLINPVIQNTNGTAPMSGIDIEPNDNKATINNILISNPITINNRNCGIEIYLARLPAETAIMTNIKIIHPIDKNAHMGFAITTSNKNVGTNSFKPLSGLIEIDNPEWYGNQVALVNGGLDLAPNFLFKNVKIYTKDSEGNNVLSQQEVSNIKGHFSTYKCVKIK